VDVTLAGSPGGKLAASGAPATLWMRAVVGYVQWLQRWRVAVALVLLGLLAGSAVLAPRLLDNTTNAYNPPDDTLASKANVELGRLFPNLATTCALGILAERADSKMVRPGLAGT
jgi:hypothetical protein